ncbi:MAG: MoeA C-terminal region [Deltaproteobacteria bacterium]|nr:MoeA C-terminal region [Deltaproteobacteria bacterium]
MGEFTQDGRRMKKKPRSSRGSREFLRRPGLAGNLDSRFQPTQSAPNMLRLCDLPAVGPLLQPTDSAEEPKIIWGTWGTSPRFSSFLPAVARWQDNGWKAQPLGFKGSSDIVGFCRANAMIVFPGDKDRMARGDRIEVLLLPDFWDRRMANGG